MFDQLLKLTSPSRGGLGWGYKKSDYLQQDFHAHFTELANQRGLFFDGTHLPYSLSNKDKARELRKNLTEAERKLWYNYLRLLPDKFYRQRPIDHYIADFYAPAYGLVIEIDGDTHYTDA